MSSDALLYLLNMSSDDFGLSSDALLGLSSDGLLDLSNMPSDTLQGLSSDASLLDLSSDVLLGL